LTGGGRASASPLRVFFADGRPVGEGDRDRDRDRFFSLSLPLPVSAYKNQINKRNYKIIKINRVNEAIIPTKIIDNLDK